jgi:hypothetical protein
MIIDAGERIFHFGSSPLMSSLRPFGAKLAG